MHTIARLVIALSLATTSIPACASSTESDDPSSGVAVDVTCTSKVQPDGSELVRIVNTSAYSHWLVGTVLQPNNMVIEAKLLSYDDAGVIFDATMRVKLEAMEDRAHELTETLGDVFSWLEKTTQR
jgi:hypothetical protein